MDFKKYKLQHSAITDIGLKRNLNEDSIGFIEVKNGYVFIVCDGMGGHEGGEIASKAAVRFIIESLNSRTIDNPTIALQKAISFANEQIYLTAQSMPHLKGMGTTLAMLLILKDEIYVAHVGDSRVYVFTDNQLLQITKDHSVVQEMVNNGILHPDEAEHHPRKNEITRALGIKNEVDPTISKVLKAKAKDRFIVCSDGLSGLISFETFSKAVADKKNPENCASDLIYLAKQGGGHDNISVQVVDVVESPFGKSEYLFQSTSPVNVKPKLNKTLLSAIVFGCIILLAGIGWESGIFINNIISVPNNKETLDTLQSTERKKDSLLLIRKGYITKDATLDSVNKYLDLTKKSIDKDHYIDSLKLSSKTAIGFLIDHGHVLKDYDSTYQLYKISETILNGLNGLKVSTKKQPKSALKTNGKPLKIMPKLKGKKKSTLPDTLNSD